MEGRVVAGDEVGAPRLTDRVPAWLLGLVPLLLIAGAIIAFSALDGPGVSERRGPPVEALAIEHTKLEPGLIEHVNLQIPTGDMTFEEARRTFELFASEVKPQLEKASLAA